MKARSIRFLLSLLVFALPAAADTIHLKDGTTLDGSILSEDPLTYVILVNVTKTIKDERTIAKADVARIVREKPDLIAFVEIEKLSPVPDLTSATEYKRRIGLVEKFLKDHRGSSKSRQAKELLASLTDEAKLIEQGGVKINGKVLSPSEYRADAYDIDARVAENTIRSFIKEGRYVDGLRAFLPFEKEFRNTKSFNELLPVIHQVIATYTSSVEQSLATYEARKKERELGLERMSSADRNSTQAAIQEETAALDARFKSEKDSKVGWVTTHPFSKAALDDTINFSRQESSRLKSLSTATPVDGGKLYRDALTTILSGGDSSAISTAIGAARTATLPAKYIGILDAAAATAATEAKPAEVKPEEAKPAEVKPEEAKPAGN